MRRFASLSALASALVLLTLGSAAAQPSQLPHKAFLPFAGHGVSMGELPRPPTALATAVPASATPTEEAPTASPTDEPPTATATATEEPSATPTLDPGGSIVGRLTENGQPVVEATGLIGPALWLVRCRGQVCQQIARSGTEGSDGRYAFRNVPALTGNDSYQVVWQNEEVGELFANPFQIGSWYAPRISSFDGRSEVPGGDIDLADIELLAPTHGTGFQGLPIPYRWQMRPGTETYRWLLCDCGYLVLRQTPAMTSGAIGRTDRYELNQYPPNVRWGNDNQYCWSLRAENSQGYGESFYARIMWFIPPLARLLPIPWQ